MHCDHDAGAGTRLKLNIFSIMTRKRGHLFVFFVANPPPLVVIQTPQNSKQAFPHRRRSGLRGVARNGISRLDTMPFRSPPSIEGLGLRTMCTMNGAFLNNHELTYQNPNSPS